MKNLSARQLFVLIFVASTGLVAGGLYLAIQLNLAACPLCILQRMCYLLLALSALIGLATSRSRPAQFVSAFDCMLLSGIGAFIAAYQVWLQRFAKGVSCTADQPWWEAFVYWAGEKVPVLFEASGLCSDPAWKLLGLSIADWSCLAFCGLFVVSLFALAKVMRAR